MALILDKSVVPPPMPKRAADRVERLINN